MATISTATLSPREFLATLPLAYKAELFNELVKDQIGSNVVWPYVPTMPKHPLRPDHPPPTTAADVDRIERVFDSPDHFIDMEAFSIRRTIQAGLKFNSPTIISANSCQSHRPILWIRTQGSPPTDKISVDRFSGFHDHLHRCSLPHRIILSDRFQHRLHERGPAGTRSVLFDSSRRAIDKGL